MPVADRPGPEQSNQRLLALLVSLVTLTAFAALYVFRSLDDNRLTSWQWAFERADIVWVFPALAVGTALAYAVSGISVPGRWQAPALFVSSFLAAAVLWGAPEVIVDTARYFVQAKYLELYGVGFFLREWGGEIVVWTDLPLVPFLHGLVFSLFGEERIAVQVFTTFLFSATVVVTWLIGRTLWDDTVGGVAGALLLAMPYLLTQAALMLVDVPTMFFLTLAVFTTIKAVRDGDVRFLVAAPVAITLAMLSKYSVWLMLSVVPVIVFVHLDRDWLRCMKCLSSVVIGYGYGTFISRVNCAG
jgi:4-amino-4-deoxy-L-arabinose transferase-like glycosyltransferase